MSAIPLHLAAFDGDNETVNRLLTQGAIPDALTNDNETPLLFAAMNGHAATVRTLLEWGTDVNLSPPAGNSILRRAIGGGHAEVVRLLLAEGADPNAEATERTLTSEEKTAAREKMREMSEQLGQLTASLGVGDTPIPDMLNTAADDDSLLEKHKPIKQSGEYQCLLLAIRSRSYETLKTLLSAGYSPTPTPDTKNMPSLLDLARTLGGGVEMVRLLLEHGANPNGDDASGTSPLQTAVMMGDLPLVRLLIEFGARTDSQEKGMSLLTYAVMRENREMIEFLLDKNIGMNDDQAEFFAIHQNRPDLAELIQHKRGTAWLSLVKAGDVDGVKAALQNGADINAATQKGYSALIAATENGDTTMVRLLLEVGADPNRHKRFGEYTPLHVAASEGMIDIARLLIENRASISVETSSGHTPLYWAAENGHSDMTDLLVSSGAQMSVVETILLRRFEAVDGFWSRGIPINYTNQAGITALHAATKVQDRELVTSLLQKGADINASDRSDHTPLFVAIVTGNIELVRLLLENGADPMKATTQRYISPLYMAVSNRNEPIVRLLLEWGASIEVSVTESAESPIVKDTDDELSTRQTREIVKNMFQPLNMALLSHRRIVQGDKTNTGDEQQQLDGLWAVIHTLLEFGADASNIDHEGNSLLSSLIEFDAPLDLIQYAIEKGAAVNPSKPRQKVPLMVAIERGRTELVALLLTVGANPNGGRTKETPLQVATKKGLTQIVMLLQKHGASDEKREAAVADLGQAEQLFLRPANESSTSPLANMRMPDFAQFGERMTARRDKRIVERRARLEAEIREAENQANEP